MLKLSKEMYSVHSADQLFDLVNDTEAYSMFVPFCTESQVLDDRGQEKLCRLVFSNGLITQTLTTRNVLERHNKIKIFLQEGPFSHLYGEWCFVEQPNGSIVKLYFEYSFNHHIVQMTFGYIFKSLSADLVKVFCERADEALR